MGPPGETTFRGTLTEEKAEEDAFVGKKSSFFDTKAALMRDGNEYEPPFGLRSVESISVRRLNVLDSFYCDEDDADVDDDDDGERDGERREESARTTAKAKKSARAEWWIQKHRVAIEFDRSVFYVETNRERFVGVSRGREVFSEFDSNVRRPIENVHLESNFVRER